MLRMHGHLVELAPRVVGAVASRLGASEELGDALRARRVVDRQHGLPGGEHLIEERDHLLRLEGPLAAVAVVPRVLGTDPGDGGEVGRLRDQLAPVLRHDGEGGIGGAGVGGDILDEGPHVGGGGRAFPVAVRPPELEAVDDVEIDAPEPLGEDAIEVRTRAPVDDRLPGGIQ